MTTPARVPASAMRRMSKPAPLPLPTENAVRKPSETRKSALRPVIPCRPRHRLSSVSSVSLGEDAARFGPGYHLRRVFVLDEPGPQDLLHRRVERHRVAGLDELGLVLADVGHFTPFGAAALGGEAGEGLLQDGAVGCEFLREGGGAARGHEGDLVLGPQILLEETRERLPDAREARELHVDVVDDQHHVARRQEVLGLVRFRRGGRVRLGGCPRPGPGEGVELDDGLGLSVLEDDEVLAPQARS